MNTTTYSITIPGDTVREHGLTVEWLRSVLVDGEFPADVRSDLNRDDLPMLVLEMTVEHDEIGDAAGEELIETVARTGFPYHVSYVDTNTTYSETDPAALVEAARVNARAWLARR